MVHIVLHIDNAILILLICATVLVFPGIYLFLILMIAGLVDELNHIFQKIEDTFNCVIGLVKKGLKIDDIKH